MSRTAWFKLSCFGILPLPLLVLSVAVRADGSDGSQLEEIVVTAEKREEPIQITPVSITALSAAVLNQEQITNVADLSSHIPNFSEISGQGGGTSQVQMSIRGVGQSDFNLTTDQSVGLYIDGVYFPRSLGAALDLIDVERIEIDRGPQGTLFGRNTTAGAVQIVSRQPEDQFAASGEVTTGSYDRADVKAMVNLPLLGERLLARISIADLNQEGYGERYYDGTRGANVDTQAGRIQLHSALSDSFTADLVLDATRKRGYGGLETLVDVNPNSPPLAFYNSSLVSQGLPPVDSRWITSNPHDTWAGERNVDNNDIRGAALTLNWKLGDSTTLKSITAYRTLSVESAYSFAPSPYPVAEQDINMHENERTQELQLSGVSLNQRLNWTSGLYYFREYATDLENVPFFQPVVATGDGNFIRVPGGYSFNSYLSQVTDSYAAYGQATYNLTDQLSAVAGARYTWEEKTLYTYLDGAFTRAPGTVDDDWHNVSPRVGLNYKFNSSLFGYASVSRGFRSGGFNGRDTSPLPPGSYNPEELTAYELGLKYQAPSGRWRLNGATFYYDYKNYQGQELTSFSGITITVGNIATVEIDGAEFEFAVKPVDRVELGLSGGYTHQNIENVSRNAQLTIEPNTRLPNAPEITAQAFADFTVWSGTALELMLHGDYGYKSRVEFFLPNYPDEGQRAYGLANALLTLQPHTHKWSIELGGTNLGNKDYRIFAENGEALGVAATSAIYGPPCEWSLRGKIKTE
jgi:iron complex outermembrane recepter protein